MRASIAAFLALALLVPAVADARPCRGRETERTVDRFLAAMRAGDARAAAALWAREPRFEWYSDARRIGAAAEDRATLLTHFRALIGDRRAPTGYRGRLRTAGERRRSLGHFHGVLRSGTAFKGAVSCARRRPKLIVWSG